MSSRNLIALTSVAAEVKDSKSEGSDENDFFRMPFIFGHKSTGISRHDRFKERREILTTRQLFLRLYRSKAHFAVKWTTNVLINPNKKDSLASADLESFIQC